MEKATRLQISINHWHLLSVRHFAEHATPFCCSLCFFSTVSDGEPFALFACVGDQEKENDI
jgi:hypothetical protein